MARGTRAPSHNAYRGTLGRTQTATVHVATPAGDVVATVYTSIDAVADPELVERLHSGDPAHALNVIADDGTPPFRVAIPVVYHDPAVELLVLILGDAHRHREVDERIALLEKLRDDTAPVPAYATAFAVVYGPDGLRAYLETRAKEAVDKHELHRELERRRAEVGTREAERDRARAELAAARAELEGLRGEVAQARADVSIARAEAAEHARDAAAYARGLADRQAAPLTSSRTPTSTTAQIMISPAAIAATRYSRGESEDDVLAHEHDHEHARGRLEAQSHGHDAQHDDEHEPTPLPAPIPDEFQTSQIPYVDIEDELVGGELLSKHPAKLPAPPAAPNGSGSNGVYATALGAPDGRGVSPVGSPVAWRGGSIDVEIDDEPTGHAIIPPGSDPLTTTTEELPLGAADPWLEFAATGATSSVAVDDAGHARLALLAGEHVARGLGAPLDVRVLLHRAPTYPVVTLVIGPPAAFRAPSLTQLAVIPLDIGAELDRSVLSALARTFELQVDVVSRGKRKRAVRLVAPLADNVGYVLRAADDHLRGLVAEADEPSYQRARDLVLGAGHDLLGLEHPDAAEFRDDKLAQLDTAQQLRRAVAIARRYARPSREDYLVCVRGFPLARWHELRRHVLESAVTWGIWMGPELAQIAVSEGLARSRRDLVMKLDHGFDDLRRHPVAFDIDADAADDNLNALAEEARALGVELQSTRPQTASSDEAPIASGSIERPSASVIKPVLPRGATVDDLLVLLGDRERRVAAAIELCERGDARAARPVIEVVTKLSRAEAVRVLGMSVRFGEPAAAPLMEGLKSSKAFLRHGCALALAMLRTEDGTQAVIDLLLAEPTEIWREVARAVGQVGPNALMPLASTVGRLGDRLGAPQQDRVAWAMAHVGVRGGRMAMEAMAAGHSIVAPIAKKAIELLASAQHDHTSVRPGANGSQHRDVTVNRAFSRRFFEALEQGVPEEGGAALANMDRSSPMETLDESDLIEEEAEDAPGDGDAEALDESDLIQS